MFSRMLQTIFFRSVGHASVENRARWKKSAQALGHLENDFFLRDRGRLSYLLLTPPEPSSLVGCVVFCHPLTKKGKYFFSESPRARSYLEAGFAVLAFDFNGFGESSSQDLFYWKDVVAAIQFAEQRFKNKKIVLHGASFGAFHLIRAIPSLPQNASVVLENVNKSLMSYWQRWKHTAVMVSILQKLRIRSILDMEVESAVRTFNRPDLSVLFIACDQDVMTTESEMKELYSQFAITDKTFEVFNGVGHLAAPVKKYTHYKNVLFGGGGVYAQRDCAALQFRG